MTKLLEHQHQSFQGVFRVDLPHGIDRFDLLAVQGAFWNPLQHHSSKASILWHSCLLYGPALTQPYLTNGKTTTLNIWTLTIQTSSTLMIHKKLKTKRTTPLRIIQNPNVILHRKSETLLLMKRVPVLDWPFKY